MQHKQIRPLLLDIEANAAQRIADEEAHKLARRCRNKSRRRSRLASLAAILLPWL